MIRIQITSKESEGKELKKNGFTVRLSRKALSEGEVQEEQKLKGTCFDIKCIEEDNENDVCEIFW